MAPPGLSTRHIHIQPLTHRLLLDEQPLYVNPKLALALNSTNGAMLIQLLRFLQGVHAEKKDAVIKDGRVWVPLTHPEWVLQTNGALSESTVRRTLASLEGQTYILSGTFRGGSKNRTKHYAVHSELLRALYVERFLPEGLTLDGSTDPFTMNESARLVFPTLVRVLGTINRALVLQQLHFQLHRIHKSPDPEVHATNFREGRYWFWRSIPDWHAKDFPFLTEDTIEECFLYLRDLGVVLAKQFNAAEGDTTNWYSIDTESLSSLVHPHPDFDEEPDPAMPIPIGSAQIPPMGSVQIPPTHEHSVSEAPGNLGSVQIPPTSSAQNPPTSSAQNPSPYIRDFKETNKDSSSDAETQLPTEERQPKTTTTGLNKNLHPIITKQMHPGFLKQIFQEVPTREEAWRALTDEQVHDAQQLATLDTSHTQFVTKLIKALDAVANNRSPTGPSPTELRNRANARRAKAAFDAQNQAYSDFGHLGQKEMADRANKAWRAIIDLPLEHFMDDGQPE